MLRVLPIACLGFLLVPDLVSLASLLQTHGIATIILLLLFLLALGVAFATALLPNATHPLLALIALSAGEAVVLIGNPFALSDPYRWLVTPIFVLVWSLTIMLLRRQSLWLALIIGTGIAAAPSPWAIAIVGPLFAHQTIRFAWLFIFSLMAIGLANLSEQSERIVRYRLVRVSPVLRSGLTTLLSLMAVLAIIAFIPLQATTVPTLAQFLKHPLSFNPLSHDEAGGKPEPFLGGSLQLNAPDVSSNDLIASYQILGGTNQPPVIIGTTLDSYANQAWSQSDLASTGTQFTFPTNAESLHARMTLHHSAAGAPWLLGFEQPIRFSIPAHAQVFAQTTPNLSTVSGWQADTPLYDGMTYDTYAVLGAGDNGGALPASTSAHLTVLPSNLQTFLQTYVAGWLQGMPVTSDSLTAAFTAHMTFRPGLEPPKGVDPVRWSLDEHQGDVLLLTTDYILLARAAGLPMALAEGYLPGIPTNGHWDIYGFDATVWARQATPNGWVDLFPVANTQLGAMTYQPTNQPQPPSAVQPPPLHPQVPAPHSSLLASIPLLGLIVALLAVVALLTFTLVRWQVVTVRRSPSLIQALSRAVVLARFGGIRFRTGDTANRATSRIVSVLPDQRSWLVPMTALYERIRYGGFVESWKPTFKIAPFLRLMLTRPFRRAKKGTYQ